MKLLYVFYSHSINITNLFLMDKINKINSVIHHHPKKNQLQIYLNRINKEESEIDTHTLESNAISVRKNMNINEIREEDDLFKVK